MLKLHLFVVNYWESMKLSLWMFIHFPWNLVIWFFTALILRKLFFLKLKILNKIDKKAQTFPTERAGFPLYTASKIAFFLLFLQLYINKKRISSS
jgi:hypothetical protein